MSTPGPTAITLVLLGLEWTRPLGLLALALPVALIVLLHLPRPPRSLATGTLAIWRRVEGEEAATSERRSRGLPPRAWLLCLALVLGALALAGPRRERPPRVESWTVIVDRSPSMYLPLEAGGTETRYAAGLGSVIEWLDEVGASAESVRWKTPGEPTTVGAGPPTAWSSPPRAPAAEPRWERWDAPGHLWLTDQNPPRPVDGAGFVATGGAAIPGPIGQHGGRRIHWDGVGLVEGEEAAGGGVEVDGSLARELVELIGIWAEERGFEVGGGAGEVRLSIRGARGDRVEVVHAARDGWTLTGSGVAPGAPLEDEEGALATWVAASGSETRLVSWGPGRVHSALREVGELGGDPAAFAASWARLFDEATLGAPGTVSVEERSDCGAGGRIEPAAPMHGRGIGESREVPVEAWLALAAGVLAVLAWFGGGGAGQNPSAGRPLEGRRK